VRLALGTLYAALGALVVATIAGANGEADKQHQPHERGKVANQSPRDDFLNHRAVP
jgi:hypothetical protein